MSPGQRDPRARRVLQEKSDFGALLWIWAFRLGWPLVLVLGVARLWLWHDDPPVDALEREDALYEAVATIGGAVVMGLVYLLVMRRMRRSILAERAERAALRGRSR